MNYKDTIRLPRTNFSMKGDLIKAEPEMLLRWEEMDIEGRISEARASSPSFVLHDGPPYANGHVHLGTALNKILKDFIVKSHTMMGYYSPYVPGWDCHGMPIEHKVMSTAAGEDLSRLEIRRRCREYASTYVDVQRSEFKRLGVFGRWEKPYLTMSYSYEAGVLRAFEALVRAGHIYRGLRPIHWCTSCSTALADAEVEYATHSSPSVYVAFSASDPAAWEARGVPAGTEVVIWTTTPWTLPANLAVALNPGELYCVVEADGRRFLVASRLAESFIAAAAPSGTVLPGFSCTGASLERLLLVHPLDASRTSLVISALHVTMEDGTGCVHTAPGHGADDFNIGREYGLEVFCPVLENGKFGPSGGKYAGLHVFAANSVIVADLQASGRLLASQKVSHSYPHCWRCKSPLIFRATEQFFLDLSHGGLKDRVLAAVDSISWHPSWGYDRMRNMMASRPDWCLSRQRNWGVGLPVFICRDCDHTVMDPDMISHVASLVESEGSDAWFSLSVEELYALWGGTPVCPACGSSSLRKNEDILDVWFDSSVSHYNVLTPEFDLERPCAVYLEATDQHRGWFGVSLITSVGMGLSIPAQNIITHGLIQDSQGKKMSKSLGNVVSPLEIVNSLGADILRLWFASVDYTADFRAEDSQLADAREGYRKIRNTVRFLLGNLEGVSGDLPASSSFVGLDRYIWLRFRKLVSLCLVEYRAFQFHRVYRELRNFMVVDLSGLYLDVRKDRLYCDSVLSPLRSASVALLGWMASGLLRLLAPIMPFTCEEAWGHLPSELRTVPSVHLALLPSVEELTLAEEEELFAWRDALAVRDAALKVLEEMRAAGEIGGGLEASVTLGLPSSLLDSAFGESWADLLIVSSVGVVPSETVTASAVRAPGSKCPRCWKVHAGTDLCSRCSSVVEVLDES